MDEAIKKQLDEVARWLGNDEAQRRARRALDRRHLDHRFADYVLSDANLRVLRTFQLRAEPYEVFEAVGFAIRIIERSAADLLRRPAHRYEVVGGKDDIGAAGIEDDPVVVTAPEGLESRVRMALHAHAGTATWATAGALVVVTVTLDGVTSFAPHVPAVGQGAVATQQPWWAGLHYAGKHDCFAGDGAAVRQRRSRAVQRMREVLAAASEDTGVQR